MKIPKFSKINFGIKNVLISRPERYWAKLLVVILIIFLAVIAFDGWVFLRFSFLPSVPIAPSDSQGSSFRKGSFNQVLEALKQKQERFIKYRDGF